MFLFVGLGNFGNKYEKNIHNAGFIIIDEILHFLKNKSEWKEKFSGLYCIDEIFHTKTIFLKPQTYMNNSGISVSQFKNFYKIDNKNIFVFHDDIDLKPLQIKIKTGGGNAGHNGLKSLDAYIGNDYHRIRIGVGRPENQENVANYVLSNFQSQDIQNLINSTQKIIDALKTFNLSL